MLSWPFLAIADLLFTIICYFTNPFVVLFCDEYGNLPKIFKWWQTYDNCLDVEWMISEECVPKVFRYDFNKHYIYHQEDKSSVPIIPGYVEIIDPNFTLIERIQRYFCRLAWLYRNTGYGFSYDVCGREYLPVTVVKHIDYKLSKDNECHIYTVNDDYSSYNSTFRLYYCKPWCKWFYLRIYFGWKITETEGFKLRHSQLAFFINPFRLINE